jgi:hypothetical protein
MFDTFAYIFEVIKKQIFLLDSFYFVFFYIQILIVNLDELV